jgi:acyl-CoA synthetase (AMP-forming)/AMP-acid ligase II
VNIAEVLRTRAEERGDAPALIETHHGKDRIITFRELQAAACGIGEQLRQWGIDSGDSVLILHPASAELYAFLIAVFQIGATGMFLDPSAGRDHVERCLRIHSPKAFFGSRKAQVLRLWIPALRRVEISLCSRPFPGACRCTLQTKGPERFRIATREASDAALITFTSGSTGEPKAALRTHGFLLAQHRVLQTSLQHRPGVYDLTTLPVFVLGNLASGVASVLPDADMRRPGHIQPYKVLKQLQRLPIETMAASPAFVSRLVEGCRGSHIRLDCMQRVYMGGAPVFPEDLRLAREIFPNAEITAVYGSTEAEPMAEIALSAIGERDFTAMQQGRGLLAGRPVPSLSLRVIRNQWGTPIEPMSAGVFGDLCLGAGAVGEIVVSGEHVLSSYLNGTGVAETKFRVAGMVWHRTGDLGRMDEKGRLWLLGRASAAILDERGVLYPFAVECAARQVAGVRRAAILAIEGRRILAIEADGAAAMDAARQAFPRAQIDEVRRLHSIPMDKRHNAKVEYATLRKMLAG